MILSFKICWHKLRYFEVNILIFFIITAFKSSPNFFILKFAHSSISVNFSLQDSLHIAYVLSFSVFLGTQTFYSLHHPQITLSKLYNTLKNISYMSFQMRKIYMYQNYQLNIFQDCIFFHHYLYFFYHYHFLLYFIKQLLCHHYLSLIHNNLLLLILQDQFYNIFLKCKFIVSKQNISLFKI